MLSLRQLYGIAHKVTNPILHILSIDDLVQEGAVAAMRAAERWDASHEVPLEAFVAIRARGAMIDAIRNASPGGRMRGKRERPKIRSLDEILPNTNAMLQDFPDESWSEEFVIRERANKGQALLLRLLEQLPPREWEIIERHYFLEEQLGDIADDWGVTQSRVSQIHTRALRLMREAA